MSTGEVVFVAWTLFLVALTIWTGNTINRIEAMRYSARMGKGFV